MSEREVIKHAENFVIKLFEERNSSNYTYHNVFHTISVVKQAVKIGKCSKFTDNEMFILVVSAWFHDTGYLYTLKNHEDKSKELAEVFLKRYGIDQNIINAVKKCIEATRFPQLPLDNISFALCDADLSHFSEDSFFEISVKLKQELEQLYKKSMDLLTYWEITFELFKVHSYHSPYGKKILAKGKERNYQKLKAKIEADIHETRTNS